MEALLIHLRKRVQQEYNEFAVCFQYIYGRADLILTDLLFYFDSLVQTLSNYQNSADAYLSQTIKIIMTHHNWANETDTTVLGYFSTTFNQGIAPGDYLWPPNNSDILPASTNPTRSRQVFAEYFDQESWLEASVPVSNASFSTAIHTVTTIDNPAFGIKGGQTVELLYIRINSDFPREIDTLEYKEELASLAESLASNDELAERIETFAVGTKMPTANPSPPSPTSAFTGYSSQSMLGSIAALAVATMLLS